MQKIFTLYIKTGAFLKDLFDSCLSIPKVILLSNFFIRLPFPTLKKASILGNGPSLRASLENDLAFIETTDIYCVNNFASSAEFMQIKPQNYVMLDPAFFMFEPKSSKREDIRKTLFCLLEYTSWEMNLFVPYKARKSYLVKQVIQNNKSIHIHYFNYTIVQGFPWFRHGLFNQNLGMPQCQNILACSLFLAIRRKYEEIYLFGADHSWHEEIRISENNELEMKQVHFYDNATQVKHAKVLDVTAQQYSKIHTIFLSLYKAFYGYEILKQYADYQEVKVLNASTKSYIDSFERVKV